MTRFVEVGRRSQIEPGTCISVEAAGRWVAVCNVGGRFYALDDTCPHAGGPLGEGTLTGETLACPWHGWQYDVRSGQRIGNPDFSVECYEVKLVGDAIHVALPDE